MNINATLLVQMIMFGFFVWFTMRFVWPLVISAMDERQNKIADGLAAAERGQRDLELAQHNIAENLRDVKVKSAQILDEANKQGNQIIEDAKEKARQEGQRLLELAQADIEKEVANAKQALRNQVANLAVSGAERILSRNIDEAANRDLVDDLIEKL